MHRKIILIVCLLLLSGCKQITDDKNYIDKVYNCLKKDKITSEVSLGYKYYIPKGVKKIKDFDYNQVFLVDDYYLYLYVDIISYFYDKKLEKIANDSAYYYENFNFKGKKGYLEILESKGEYYLNLVYNYSKIEGYVPKEKLNKVITLSSIILNSIEYNHVVIEKILEGELGQFSEFTYEVDKPEGAGSNFSQILEEYVQKDDEIDVIEGLPDE